MPRTLVLGYGNLDRADDGVAWYVVSALRDRLGQKGLDDEATGLDDLGQKIDSVFIGQLVPELMDTALLYDRLIFVDAHVGEDIPELACSPVAPEHTAGLFTHHLTPPMFLAMLKALYDRAPAAHLVSILGRDFDFRRGLSEAARTLVEPAVDRILDLIGPL